MGGGGGGDRITGTEAVVAKKGVDPKKERTGCYGNGGGRGGVLTLLLKMWGHVDFTANIHST